MGCGGSSLKSDSPGNADGKKNLKKRGSKDTDITTLDGGAGSRKGSTDSSGGRMSSSDGDSPPPSSGGEQGKEGGQFRQLLAKHPPITPQEEKDYSDPFDFFEGSGKTFDNTKERSQNDSTSSGVGLLGIMEGLAGSCKKTVPTRGTNPALPEKAFPPGQEIQKISDSQIDFFKMLDERINNGPDDESFTDSTGRIFTRSTSAVAPSDAITTTSSSINRRWSASKVTNPRSPTSPEDTDNKFNFISRAPANGSLKEENTDGEEPAKKPSPATPEEDISPSEPVKEQYMFLGNLYTLTRPRIQTPNCTPATVAVTPVVKTQEDLHLESEMNVIENSVSLGKSGINWEKSIGSDEVNDFWMDLEITDEIKNTKLQPSANQVPNSRRRASLPSDIVKGGFISLRTVIE